MIDPLDAIEGDRLRNPRESSVAGGQARVAPLPGSIGPDGRIDHMLVSIKMSTL
jgi:hypothetical protein